MSDKSQYPNFSVLMSVYIKEKASYLDECLQSLLEQTVKPSEIVIVFDGPVTEELRACVESYKKKHPDLFIILDIKVNRGLGPALADGLLACSYELIARMDADDIARNDRFERQLEQFNNDPSLDICGSNIIEFTDNIDNILSIRRVPLTHQAIVDYQKTRSAFNHMTVMYKKSAVLRAGNYQDAPLMEDDLLWVHMIQTGAICKNIDANLVYARTGYDMIARRGGWNYFKKYKKGRKGILETGYISQWDYYKTLVVQFVIALLPQKIRLLIFTNLLR